jgi:hypothetical protein
MKKPLPPANEESKVSIGLDVVPVPTSTTTNMSSESISKQTQALAELKKKGFDLFEENPTIVSKSQNNLLYQTADLYGRKMSVEEMLPIMKENNLTIRVNVNRMGHMSQNSCLELSAKTLSDALNETPDARGEKNCELNVHNVPGIVYVGFSQYKGQHYIQKVDYSILESYDRKMHV